MLVRGGAPCWRAAVVYRVNTHTPECANTVTYFNGHDARVLARTPVPTQRKYPYSPADMVDTTHVSRAFEIKSDHGIFCGGESISRHAASIYAF